MMRFSLSTTVLLLLGTGLSTSAPISPPKAILSVVVLDCAKSPCHHSNMLPSNFKAHSLPATANKIQILPADSKQSTSFPYEGTPWSPPTEVPASHALAVERPLSSNYLLSLREGHQQEQPESVEGSVLVAVAQPKSIRPLHELEKQDLAQFWSTEHASRRHDNRQHRHHAPCHEEFGFIYLPGNIYVKSTQYISRRPDIMVVGIVLSFLVLVMCVESTESIRDLFTKIFNCTCTKRKTMSKGEIFLAGDESVTFTRKDEALSIQAYSEKEASTGNVSEE